MANQSVNKGKKLDPKKVYLINKYFHDDSLSRNIIAERLSIALRTIGSHLLTKEEWVEQKADLKAQTQKES